MGSSEKKMVILGNEWDEALKASLKRVLLDLGAVPEGDEEWGVAGSQELYTAKFRVNDEWVEVESETYIGLSVTGPSSLVERIRQAVQSG
jgi:hypothetical protein